MNVWEPINAGLAKLGFKEIRENQRKVVEAYVGGRNVLTVAPTVSGKSLPFHHSLCIGLLQTWRARSCRHSLPRYFPFGFTNERSSVDPSWERGQSHCLGPRNFWDRKAAQAVKYLHHTQFFLAPTICKLNSIFCRRIKSTRDFIPRFHRLETRLLSHFCSRLVASLRFEISSHILKLARVFWQLTQHIQLCTHATWHIVPTLNGCKISPQY